MASSSVLSEARRLLAAGISIIPVGREGDKAPAFSMLPRNEQNKATWLPFQSERASEGQARRWFSSPEPPGIAAIGGAVSGGLECIDFDALADSIYPVWCELVEDEAPGLLARLAVVLTPRRPVRGRHVWLVCPDAPIPGNLNLAMNPEAKDKADRTLIQTRGEGGYAVVPGSPPACHRSNVERAARGEPVVSWEYVGDSHLAELRPISPDEREVLMRAACSFDRAMPKQPAVALAPPGTDLRPGDDFDRRGPDWSSILEGAGWRLVRSDGEVRYWARPGKEGPGWSATTGRCKGPSGEDLLRVFTSNAAPLEEGRAYGKFRCYAALQHGGDHAQAAKELARQGYGAKKSSQSTQANRQGRAFRDKPDKEDGSLRGRGERSCAPGDSETQNPPTPPPEWSTPVPLAELPPTPVFPLEVLPPSLQDFAAEVAWSLNCPVDFAAVPMLSVAGGAIANSRRLSITRTHRPTAALWACVVGDPGSGKTPAMSLVTEPFWAAQRERMSRWKADKKAFKDDSESEKDPGPPSRLVVDDFTIESLVSILADNPRGLMCVKDELASLVTGMNQYKAGGQGNDRQNVLKLWSGETIVCDRKSNPDGAPLIASRPFLSIAGGTQPDVVPSLRGDTGKKGRPAPNDGMLDRFLVSYPPSLPAMEETWREVSEAAAAEWDRVIHWLLSLPMAGAPGDQYPALVPLTSCGRDGWQSFTRDHADEINGEDFPEFLRGPWAKFKGYCGRLALVLHLLRDSCSDDVHRGVDGDSLARAHCLVRYFKAHARKVLAAMEADPVVPLAKRILAWVERERPPCFKRHQVYEDVKNRSHFPSLDALEKPLERLCRHNYLRSLPGDRNTGGRPETTTYEVNPQLLSQGK